MTDLTAFIKARLAEDEAAARAAMDGSEGQWAAEADLGVGAVIDDRREIVAYDEGRPTEGQADHIARHDPARVLAEVAAKRRIIEWCEQAEDGADDYILQLLAQAAADHDDYDPAWRP